MNWLSRLFRRAPETRASGAGYTAAVMAAREQWISGRSGLGELTATVQSCVSLWENGLSMASVNGTDLLTPATMGMVARALALRGEAVLLIDDAGLVPASDWDVSTMRGRPRAYRLTLPDAGGGESVTALAGEVLHLRIGSDPSTPWAGQAPLSRAQISAGMLHSLETALGEVFDTGPLGSIVIPFPENPQISNDDIARSFRGKRGRVLLRESVVVTAAGGPTPATDWRPSSLSPDIEKAKAIEALDAARNSVAMVFGVLPALLNPATTGPVVREAQRHLATWTLQPVANLVAAEATEKLGSTVTVDTLSPLQAYDAGGRARALKGAIDAMAAAKEAGLSEGQIEAAARFAGVPAD